MIKQSLCCIKCKLFSEKIEKGIWKRKNTLKLGFEDSKKKCDFALL